MVFFLLAGTGTALLGQVRATPLEFLKEQERTHRAERGPVYLGKVMDVDLQSPPDLLGEADQRLLLELTDVLKSPLRDNYRLVLKECSVNETAVQGTPGQHAEALKELLIQKYGLEGSRISVEGGCEGPAGRVEVHVYGDISRAVRFTGDGGER